MPSVSSLVSPTLSTKSYAPLADEVNPPFGNTAPAPVAHNGSVVYSKRISPPSSSVSASDDGDGNSPTRNTHNRIRSDHTGSTVSAGSGGSRRLREWGEVVDDGDGDIGVVSSRRAKGKGKERERAWDSDGYSYGPRQSQSNAEEASSYPPLNENDEEEKRVQANLAKFTARETARRKAARSSRTLSSSGSSSPTSPTSSAGSLSRSGTTRTTRLTSISETGGGASTKRSNSILGYVGSLVGGKAKSENNNEADMPLSPNIGQGETAYTNPYDNDRSNFSAASASARLGPTPSSPVMHKPSPFADPPEASGSRGAATTSPIDDASYGYAGADWRGGAGGAGGGADGPAAEPPRERWWHALCAWGSELDGGHSSGQSKQVGRTNPFE